MLTYFPAEDTADGSESNRAGVNSQSDPRGALTGYSPRQLLPIECSCAVLPEAITTSDEPGVRDALKYPRKSYWTDPMNEEFLTLYDAKTSESCDQVPPDAEVIPFGIILRLNRNESVNPARFKGRLVSRSNLQSRRNITVSGLYAPIAFFEIKHLFITLSIVFGWS